MGSSGYKLPPTLWRTCRIIACETRLSILWSLFENDELCVIETAAETAISSNNATTQLRALNARGLIVFRREKMRVIYRAEANQAVNNSLPLLNSLKKCYKESVPFEAIIWQATAFTHERRIEIVQSLNHSKQTFSALHSSTGMSSSSLSRHLKKLKARGFVQSSKGIYSLSRPNNSFGKTLLKIARD